MWVTVLRWWWQNHYAVDFIPHFLYENGYIDVGDGCWQQNVGDKYTEFVAKIFYPLELVINTRKSHQILILSPTSENCHQHSVIIFLLGLHNVQFVLNIDKNIEHPKIGAVIVSAERILLGWVYSKLLPLVFKSGRRHLPLVFTSRTGQTKRFLDYLSLPNQDEFYFRVKIWFLFKFFKFSKPSDQWMNRNLIIVFIGSFKKLERFQNRCII